MIGPPCQYLGEIPGTFGAGGAEAEGCQQVQPKRWLIPTSVAARYRTTPIAYSNKVMPIRYIPAFMSDRTRTDAGRYAETVTPERVLEVFDLVDGPTITSSDVAGILDCSTEAARQKLNRLHEQGRIHRRKAGRTVLWWLADDGDTPTVSGIDPDESFWTAAPGSADEPTDAAKTDEYLADVMTDE